MRQTDRHPVRTLFVFDPSISRNNPTGSCMLKMLEAVSGRWPVRTFIDRTDLPGAPLLQQTRVPLPSRPELARRVLFPILATCAWLLHRIVGSVRIATEAACPFCQISHTQFCHRYFLRHHRNAIATTWARRVARTLTHYWCSVIESVGFRYATKIVVPSQGTGRELLTTYPRLTQNKIVVIANPVDTQRFQRPAGFGAGTIRQQLGIQHPALVLSFCALGGFTRKGLDIVLESLAQIGNPRIHLIVVGGRASEIREFQAIAQRLHLTHSVHFVGLQNDIRPFLWSSDIFVLPSAYEGLPLVCLQAAAAGLPLIATRINGIEDFLMNGVNGWIIERTPESAAAAIRDAAAQPGKASEMGQAAQLHAQDYDDKVFQARWLQLLEQEFGIGPFR